ncbi:hypothetical protein MACK_003792 [Theileria orientalis]|uniref:Uncharacterized protein n=1 Tax=Theileria orientalis TaxID=68886 RepID=A0A976SIW7_THEOR|nr:hypothetical protein MACK_003792 [Theileria orientalis]
MFSDSKYTNVKYINHCREILNIKSVPSPRLIKAINIYKYKYKIEEGTYLKYNYHLSLTKYLFGKKIDKNDIKRPLIIGRILNIYPIELRSILFSFANRYLYSMSSPELSDFDELLDTHSEDNNSKLLDYLLAKEDVPSELLQNNVLAILFKFVSHNHPLLENR